MTTSLIRRKAATPSYIAAGLPSPIALGRALALGLLIATAAPAAADEAVDLDDFRVTRAGEVLFDRGHRSAYLASLDPAARTGLCGAATAEWPSHKAVTRIATPSGGDERTDVRSAPFAWTIMTAAAAAYANDDPLARRALIANLRRWARGEALTKLQDREENTYYALERTLLPTIVGFSLVRDHPDLDRGERRLIESWLNRLVRLRGVKRPEDSKGPISQRNNHRNLSDSVDMAWGALRADDRLFREGIRSLVLALGQIRADGSLPLETARGAAAIWYQRHAIASLVTIAEIGAVQGYDLYRLTVAGRSLHDAIRFLADAIDDPEIVVAYARENLGPHPSTDHRIQDLDFMNRRGHGRHYMAWLEPYRARFPDLPTSRRLTTQLARFDAAPPLIDEYSGGNLTCFFGAPAARPASMINTAPGPR